MNQFSFNRRYIWDFYEFLFLCVPMCVCVCVCVVSADVVGRNCAYPPGRWSDDGAPSLSITTRQLSNTRVSFSFSFFFSFFLSFFLSFFFVGFILPLSFCPCVSLPLSLSLSLSLLLSSFIILGRDATVRNSFQWRETLWRILLRRIRPLSISLLSHDKFPIN